MTFSIFYSRIIYMAGKVSDDEILKKVQEKLQYHKRK